MDGDRRTDAQLVAAVLAGDREAFGPLLARWQPSVLGLCRRLVGPGPLAEDVAQEAAVQAFLGLPRLADPARFGAWLHAIAANQARMALRRRPRLALEGLPPHVAAGLRGGESSPTPEDAWASRETHQAILAALKALPPATREAVIGFYLHRATATKSWPSCSAHPSVPYGAGCITAGADSAGRFGPWPTSC
jgi:RNA polymerase sigma-70 factor, ECF subfamily